MRKEVKKKKGEKEEEIVHIIEEFRLEVNVTYVSASIES